MKHLYTLILLLLLTFSHSFSQTKKLLTNEETIKIKINTLVNRSKNQSVQEAQNNLQEGFFLIPFLFYKVGKVLDSINLRQRHP